MIKFGIIGTSSIADWFISGAKMDSRFTISCIYSRSMEKGTAFAKKYSVDKVFTDFEPMLEHIDAVYIASPNYIHAKQALYFIERGKSVLCEKPLCSNAKEGKMLTEASKKYNVPFMEAMVSTLNPNFIALMDNLEKIGKPIKYFSSYCQYSSRYDNYKKGIVENAFKLELSNGALVDIGIYTIYPMVVLFGKPKSIKAIAGKMTTGVDSSGVVIFEYPDNLQATISYSKISDSFLPTEIQGEKGAFLLDRINIPRGLILKRKNCETLDLSAKHCGNDYYYEAKIFMDIIESGEIEHPINSHLNSMIVLEIMDEIRKQIGVLYPADIDFD